MHLEWSLSQNYFGFTRFLFLFNQVTLQYSKNVNEKLYLEFRVFVIIQYFPAELIIKKWTEPVVYKYCTLQVAFRLTTNQRLNINV